MEKTNVPAWIATWTDIKRLREVAKRAGTPANVVEAIEDRIAVLR